ncbi:hypothetical protein AS149_37065 [Burkholderia cenocepacia]|nr:hypothetical protein AS149_37065 [Burkholderia cenocepacia]
MPPSTDAGWFGQVEQEWSRLRRQDSSLDLEKFFRHVLSAHKVGFLTPESLAVIANAFLISPLNGAPYLGRRLLERVNINRHPALRMALAISLVTGTGGEADFDTGHAILVDVSKDESAGDAVRAVAIAAIADSARTGRGMDADLTLAKKLYSEALELGWREAAFNLGLYYEGRWGDSVDGDILPDRAKAIQVYKRGGSNEKCLSRIDALRAAH